MNDNKLFVKIIEEKYERFLDSYSLMNSDFLSLDEQSMLSGFLRTHRNDGVMLFGGYEEAERKQVIFVPDYLDIPDENSLREFFLANETDCPLTVLDIKVPKNETKKLTHRDYLGALMGEGIKREKIGDIIVTENGANIICTKEMAEYLLRNYRQVGRVTVSTSLISLSELDKLNIKTELAKFSVASPRLDNVVSAVFNISRKDATDAIAHGKVFANGIEMTKPDYSLKGNEKIVLRGKGKAIYLGITGTSKKGKAYIEVKKYV